VQQRQLKGALSLHRVLAAVAAVLVLALVVLAATPLRSQFMTASLIAVSGTLAALILLCILLLVAETGGRHGR
jgi:hypothetical protein